MTFDVCPACRREYDGSSCVGRLPLKDGQQVIPHVRHAPRWEGDDDECEGCWVDPGGVHHAGCDREECPLCARQLIGCRCFREEVHPQLWDDLELPKNMKPMRQDLRYGLRDLGVV